MTLPPTYLHLRLQHSLQESLKLRHILINFSGILRATCTLSCSVYCGKGRRFYRGLQWIGRAWLTTLSITIESGRSNKPTAWEICSCVLGHIHTQILSLIVILYFSFKEGHLGFCKMTTYDENNVPGKASYPCSGAIFPAWHCPFKIENINRFKFQIFIVKWFYFLNDLFQISKGDLYLTFSISSSEISLILLIYTFRTQRMW